MLTGISLEAAVAVKAQHMCCSCIVADKPAHQTLEQVFLKPALWLIRLLCSTPSLQRYFKLALEQVQEITDNREGMAGVFTVSSATVLIRQQPHTQQLCYITCSYAIHAVSVLQVLLHCC